MTIAPEHLQRMEGITLNPPPLVSVMQTGQGVGHDVEIGRDMQAMQVDVIAGVADDDQLLGVHHFHQALQEFRGTDATREHCDHIAFPQPACG